MSLQGTILTTLGKTLARSPEWLPRCACAALGRMIYYMPGKRRRTLKVNLERAFPEKDDAWLRQIAITSCCRTVETGMLALASSYMTEEQIKDRFALKTPSQEIIDLVRAKKPLVGLIPHLALMEAVSLISYQTDYRPEKIGVIYRPFDNPALEQAIRESRSRYSVSLLSRKAGFSEAQKLLSEGQMVALLFDQNAGEQGTLTLLFDRVCSTTSLPDLLCRKHNATPVVVYSNRTEFWRTEIIVEPLRAGEGNHATTLAANQWLENKLKQDENLCASWLWLHDRWRTQDFPRRRFQLHQNRNALKEDLAQRKLDQVPRNTHLWIRLPNWLGDVVMAIPLIRAIRESRPDLSITLLGQKHFMPLLQRFQIADALIPLPKKGITYYWHILKLRKEHPDVHLLFTNSLRGDLEAKLIGAPHRYGMLRPGKSRPLLSHTWALPADLDETKHHQCAVWESFLKHFGLTASPIRKPFSWSSNQDDELRIGFICGTENDPSKRWQIPHWQQLITLINKHYPDAKCYLFGTRNDRAITDQVIDGLPPGAANNLAGQTDLIGFADGLSRCRILVCNDTGGMHLANALGVTVLGVFGPTNPVRTGPCFDAPHTIIQPEDCPPTGGIPIDKVEPERVFSELKKHL